LAREIKQQQSHDTLPQGGLATAERDVVALGIAVAAILLFIGNGGQALTAAYAAAAGMGLGPNTLLTNTLLLNVALVIFGWRRYADLSHEVSQRRQAEAYARLLAETDPLTGCLNRRSIGPATDELINQARQRGESVAFVMIDLDNFKQVNDCHGHAAGDALLLECARRIQALVPPRSLVARLGGDEFACVVTFDPRYPERIDHLAAAIIEGVSTPLSLGDFSGSITVSAGLTRSDRETRFADAETGSTAAALLHMADIAMYQAKKAGRNRYTWFEDTMESELRYRSELERGIREGIGKHEFVPYYEQQVDIATGKLVGFEMLARWHSPVFGMVSPEVFIPIAEEIGVIADLSEQLIAQALCDAQGWDSSLTLSVNISPVQLRDPWFAQKLLKLLVTANFPANRLDIEITESCLHNNSSGVHALITSLKNQGVTVSLDDFGAGYSSLSQLRSLPFDRIKIDRSFVTTMAHDKESETIIETINALGQGLRLPITAEGIESQEVLEMLTRLGGQIKGQGYLYGRPQPAEQVSEMLARRNAAPEVTEAARQAVADLADARRIASGDSPAQDSRRQA
jgi:diguanylate cyclase (GGDEF)-like protein